MNTGDIGKIILSWYNVFVFSFKSRQGSSFECWNFSRVYLILEQLKVDVISLQPDL